AGTTGRNGAAATPSGETTTVAVGMAGMRFDPEVLEVPAGHTLVIELSNDDAHDVHDLVLANGVTSGRPQRREPATLEAGTIEADLEGWCSIVGHREMGMTLQVVAAGATQGRPEEGSAGAAGVDELSPVALDLQAEPGPEHVVRDAALPDPAGREQRLTLEVTAAALEMGRAHV